MAAPTESELAQPQSRARGPSLVTQTLEYANPRNLKLQKPKVPRSFWPAAIIVIIFFAAQLFHRNHGPLTFAIPIVWLCGAWYCWARGGESKAPVGVRISLRLTSIISVLLAPFLICPSPGNGPGVLRDLRQLGWHTRYVSDLERDGVILVAACLVIHGIVQPLDWLLRRRHLRRSGSRRFDRVGAEQWQWIKAWFCGPGRWRAMSLVAIVVLAFGTVQYGVPMYRRWSWARRISRWTPAQYAAMVQCMGYVEPTTQVIYSNDPQVVSTLSSSTHLGYDIGDTPGSLRHGPACWNQMLPLPGSGSAFAYLHRMKSSDGNERLVAISWGGAVSDYVYRDGKDDRLVQLWECVYVPGTVSKAPVNLTYPAAGIMGFPKVALGLELRLRKTDQVTIYAGQPHPTDPTAFTIDYVLNGVRDTIDGRLIDNSVQLKRRRE